MEGYNQMMDYFSSCRLFDRPLFELNSVRHLIFNLQDKYDQKNGRLWTEKNFTLYQKFIIDHRPCGVFVKLILDETTQETVKANVEEERILIKASKPVISYNNEVLTNSKTRKMGRLK